MRKTIRKEKGITLIALVVTIIILLILAGVAIASVTGDNGLFRKAKEATNTYKDEEIKEQGELSNAEGVIGNLLDENERGSSKYPIRITVNNKVFTVEGPISYVASKEDPFQALAVFLDEGVEGFSLMGSGSNSPVWLYWNGKLVYCVKNGEYDFVVDWDMWTQRNELSDDLNDGDSFELYIQNEDGEYVTFEI